MKMSLLLRLFSLFILCFCIQVQAALPLAKNSAVKVELIADKVAAVPGNSIELGLLISHEPGWHTYWKATGDTGLPTEMQLKLPKGWSATELQWPTPQVFRLGELVNYGYDGQVLLPFTVQVPQSAQSGTSVDISAHVTWLMCQDQCIPGSADPVIKLPIAAEAKASVWAEKFISTNALVPASFKELTAYVDEKTHAVRLDFPAENESGSKIDTFYVCAEGEGTITYNAPQSIKKVNNQYQITLQGSEELKPEETFSGLVVANGGPSQGGWAKSFSAALKKGKVTPPSSEQANTEAPITDIVAIGLAFLGGLILNLMPCVFPVLSLKILGLVENSRKKFLLPHGLAFLFGVLLTMGSLGLILMAVKAAGASVGWGFQLQSAWFVALLALLFTAITLNLWGLFEISFFSIQTRENSKNSLIGSFFTGILAVIIASPCTAPFMGAALGYALSAEPLQAFEIFLALGFGMALPWVVLTSFPIFSAWLPKPGNWMVIFKKVMAIPMGATVLWLFWVLWQQVGTVTLILYIVCTLALITSLYLIGRMQFGLKASKGALIGAGVICLGLYAFASSGLIADKKIEAAKANAWSPELVVKKLAEGQPVFVDFTASWCVTCQANKLAVLDRDSVQAAFKKKNVAFLIADWTNRDSRITEALKEFGRSGVPLYVLYFPDGKVKVLPELLTPEIVINALEDK